MSWTSPRRARGPLPLAGGRPFGGATDRRLLGRGATSRRLLGRGTTRDGLAGGSPLLGGLACRRCLRGTRGGGGNGLAGGAHGVVTGGERTTLQSRGSRR